MQDENSTPPPPQQPAPPAQAPASSFFGKLFDFSFQEFITLSLIKLIYALLMIFAGLGALVFLITMLAQGGAALVAGLIGAPIIFLLYIILARVYLEVLIVVFRIADNTKELVEQGRRIDR